MLRARLSDGSSCTSKTQCASNWCNGGKCEKAYGGHSCLSSSECNTGSCIGGKCAISRAGQRCLVAEDCSTLGCTGYSPETGFSCGAAIGTSCSDYLQCGTMECDRGTCGRSSNGKFGHGGRCFIDSDCLSGLCTASQECDGPDDCVADNRCSLSKQGQPCRRDWDCSTGRCSPVQRSSGLGICIQPSSQVYITTGGTCYSDVSVIQPVRGSRLCADHSAPIGV